MHILYKLYISKIDQKVSRGKYIIELSFKRKFSLPCIIFFVFTTTLMSRYFYYPNFTDEESEARRVVS